MLDRRPNIQDIAVAFYLNCGSARLVQAAQILRTTPSTIQSATGRAHSKAQHLG